MQKMFLAVNHGTADEAGHLDMGGQLQMLTLADAVDATIVYGREDRVCMVCSTATIARESAAMLEDLLGIPKEAVRYADCLRRDSTHRGDVRDAKRLVVELLEHNTLVIAVTHLDLMLDLAFFVAARLGTHCSIADVKDGHGLLVAAEGVSVVPK